MSTRGVFGYYKEGKTIAGYNHFDSYPSGLGKEIIKFLKNKDLESIQYLWDNYQTSETNDVWDWYNGAPYFQFRDVTHFLEDSLSCEFAYIINLDDKVLEYYKGLNQYEDREGRYKTKDPRIGFYGVSLEQTIPLESFFKGEIEVMYEAFVVSNKAKIYNKLKQMLNGKNIKYTEATSSNSLLIDSDTGNGVLIAKGNLEISDLPEGAHELIYDIKLSCHGSTVSENTGRIVIRDNMEKVLNFILYP